MTRNEKQSVLLGVVNKLGNYDTALLVEHTIRMLNKTQLDNLIEYCGEIFTLDLYIAYTEEMGTDV